MSVGDSRGRDDELPRRFDLSMRQFSPSFPPRSSLIEKPETLAASATRSELSAFVSASGCAIIMIQAIPGPVPSQPFAFHALLWKHKNVNVGERGSKGLPRGEAIDRDLWACRMTLRLTVSAAGRRAAIRGIYPRGPGTHLAGARADRSGALIFRSIRGRMQTDPTIGPSHHRVRDGPAIRRRSCTGSRGTRQLRPAIETRARNFIFAIRHRRSRMDTPHTRALP